MVENFTENSPLTSLEALDMWSDRKFSPGKRGSGFCGSINYRNFMLFCACFMFRSHNSICWSDTRHRSADCSTQLSGVKTSRVSPLFQIQFFFLQEHSSERHKTFELLETSRKLLKKMMCWWKEIKVFFSVGLCSRSNKKWSRKKCEVILKKWGGSLACLWRECLTRKDFFPT